MDAKDKKIEQLETEIRRLKAAFTQMERKVLQLNQRQGQHDHKIRQTQQDIAGITRRL